MTELVRLYGRVVGYSSHAQVTRGFANALQDAGKLAGVVGLDADQTLDDDGPPGALSPHGVFTGPLNRLDVLTQNCRHARRWAMVAPNSNLIPDPITYGIKRFVTDVLVPSDWAAGVMRTIVKLPVHVVPHGVHAGFAMQQPIRQQTRQAYREGYFRVTHFSTSERERKGTVPLLQAWELLIAARRLPPLAQLDLVLDGEAYRRVSLWMSEHGLIANVRLLPRGVRGAPNGLPPEQLAIYLNSMHVVCQPSRGEAWGMVGLEALACGTPIVATRATGHAHWFTQGLAGAVPIQHGPDAPIDDMPGAVGPSVEPEAIAAALDVAYDRWVELEDAATAQADHVRREWAWTDQLTPFIRMLSGESARAS